MKKGVFFYSSVVILPLFAIVVVLQWFLVAPYKEVWLSNHGALTSYILDTNKNVLHPNDLGSEKLEQPLARRSENILTILRGGVTYNYLKNNYLNSFWLVQESKERFTTPKKVAILYIATGKYIVFWEKFYKEMEEHFLPRHEKTYFLFTDHDEIEVAKNVIKIHQDQLPWPYITFKRYHFFEGIEKELKKFDYIYFLNGTMLPTATINEEIFPTKEQEVMVTIHPAFFLRFNYYCPFDTNEKSKAYVDPMSAKHYFMGGFNGGTREGFLKLIKTLRKWTDIDIKNNQMPKWHDESMLNSYIANEVMPKGIKPLILFPEYAIPEDSAGWELDELYPYTKMVIINKSRHGGHNFLRGLEEKKN